MSREGRAYQQPVTHGRLRAVADVGKTVTAGDGLIQIVFSSDLNGWVLPGGGLVKSRLRAQELATRIAACVTPVKGAF